jgi:glycosyltransferase involved in cell wall biosynthesis
MAVSNDPLVSVIITNYNYGRFLPEAVESVKVQTYPNVEIIVVDDGSTDDSKNVILNYEKAITPIFQDHAGQVAAFNKGYSASSGDIIAFLDADDLFLPHKLEEIVRVYQQFPNIGWSFHRMTKLDIASGAKLLTHAIPDSYLDLRARVKMGRSLPWFSSTSSLTFRRSTLTLFFPVPVPDEDRAVYIDDGYLKIMAIGLSPGYSINKPLAQIRIHGQNRRTGNAQVKIKNIKRNIWLAYYLSEYFPRYSTRFAVRALGYGWRICWRYVPQEKEAFSHYWNKISLQTKTSILFRAFLYAIREALIPNRNN